MLLTVLMLLAMLTLSLSGISAILQYLILLLVSDVNKRTEYVSVRTSQIPFTSKSDHITQFVFHDTLHIVDRNYTETLYL